MLNVSEELRHRGRKLFLRRVSFLSLCLFRHLPFSQTCTLCSAYLPTQTKALKVTLLMYIFPFRRSPKGECALRGLRPREWFLQPSAHIIRPHAEGPACCSEGLDLWGFPSCASLTAQLVLTPLDGLQSLWGQRGTQLLVIAVCKVSWNREFNRIGLGST